MSLCFPFMSSFSGLTFCVLLFQLRPYLLLEFITETKLCLQRKNKDGFSHLEVSRLLSWWAVEIGHFSCIGQKAVISNHFLSNIFSVTLHFLLIYQTLSVCLMELKTQRGQQEIISHNLTAFYRKIIWSGSISNGAISLEKSVWIEYSAAMCYSVEMMKGITKLPRAWKWNVIAA